MATLISFAAKTGNPRITRIASIMRITHVARFARIIDIENAEMLKAVVLGGAEIVTAYVKEYPTLPMYARCTLC